MLKLKKIFALVISAAVIGATLLSSAAGSKVYAADPHTPMSI